MYIVAALVSWVSFVWVYTLLQKGFSLLTPQISENSALTSAISTKSTQGISVVIAARNEGKHISACLSSIIACAYPQEKVEIWVVDDHSSDDMSEIITSKFGSSVHYLRLPEGRAGKKAAISYGVAHANFNIIACTDADCLVPLDWLSDIDRAMSRSEVNMATGMVLPESGQNCLDAFQRLDMAGSMLLTATGIHTGGWQLANGANMAFRKEFFIDKGGFSGNETIASGDDVFLATKAVIRNKKGLSFFAGKEPVVTKSEQSWSDLWMQRKRWASKSFFMPRSGLLLVQGVIFLYTLFCLSALVVPFIYGVEVFWLTLLLVGSKILGDAVIFYRFIRITGTELPMMWFPVVFWIYFWHILRSGNFAIFRRGFRWKGRAWQWANRM